MAVTRACQGQGLGRQLLRAAIARFQKSREAGFIWSPAVAWALLWPCTSLRDSSMNPVQSRRTISERTFIWSTASHEHQGLNSQYFPGKSRLSQL